MPTCAHINFTAQFGDTISAMQERACRSKLQNLKTVETDTKTLQAASYLLIQGRKKWGKEKLLPPINDDYE